MLARAEIQRELLVSRGMSPTLLDDLGRAIAELETSFENASAGRLDHTGASSDLRAVAREIIELVRVLDGLVRYRFGTNEEVMGAWTSARNVAGPSRSRAASPGNGDETNPSAPGDVAPAA